LAEHEPIAYTTELEGIRAPLGVILYLIRRDNLDIYDIPIARITKEYLDYLNMMDETQIELAGEFFVLAATLMRVKVQMLLRRDNAEDDDPRDELVRSLLEYKKMVEAAKGFRDLEEERRNIFMRPVKEEDKKKNAEEPEIDMSLYRLMKAFHDVMVEFEAAEVREIELEEYTIEEKVEAVEAALRAREQVAFTDLFKGAGSRMELIVTLMALLELIKHAHIKSQQESAFGPVWIYRGENFGKPLGTDLDWETEPDAPVEVAAPVEDTTRDTENVIEPVPEKPAADEVHDVQSGDEDNGTRTAG